MLWWQQVYRESGRHVEAFLQLQQLRQVAPRYPGLSQLMTAAAQAAAGSQRGPWPAEGPTGRVTSDTEP